MFLPIYLDLLVDAERALAYSFRTVAYGHSADADVYYLAESFAAECDKQAHQFITLRRQFEAAGEADPERLRPPAAHRRPQRAAWPPARFTGASCARRLCCDDLLTGPPGRDGP